MVTQSKVISATTARSLKQKKLKKADAGLPIGKYVRNSVASLGNFLPTMTSMAKKVYLVPRHVDPDE